MSRSPRVIWFRQNHEHRNDWLRFGFMRRARDGELTYVELPWEARTAYGFEDEPTATAHKANSLLVVEDGTARRRCVVESNDSFHVMSHLVDHADLYFCAGYNTTFFRERRVPDPLAWQSEADHATYAQRGAGLIARHGEHFDRVRPFIPIAPNLGGPRHTPPWRQRLKNARHKIESRLRRDYPWRDTLAGFEARYAALLALRDQPCQHDVVLLDTLWGWPRHRLALHERLAALAAAGYDIRSRLGWHEPSEWDGSAGDPLDPAAFPLVSGGPVEGYETMLAQSRLAPFATGFHYGWRNIMTLALMIGTPVLADRIILEPWFGLDRFRIAVNDDADWASLASTLAATTDAERTAIAAHNTATFDAVMTPEASADYVVRTALG
ncbi:hypothetical protein [Acuticoccus yangtzensis]|uniref:hypothetical protein n=1 Tax=Acuticoccus yangtzensis TaxID=1443441 RepID=UPI000ADADAB9|nr:hypothetical protein [Acuticoccus yangtzensis]